MEHFCLHSHRGGNQRPFKSRLQELPQGQGLQLSWGKCFLAYNKTWIGFPAPLKLGTLIQACKSQFVKSEDSEVQGQEPGEPGEGQQVKAFAIKPNDLSSIPGAPKAKGENQLCVESVLMGWL